MGRQHMGFLYLTYQLSSEEGCGKVSHMRRLIRAFAARVHKVMV